MATIKSVQFKRGNKDALEAKLIGDDKPKAGEPIWELDSNRIKLGDGEHGYADLKYLGEADKEDFVIEGYLFNGQFYKEPQHFNTILRLKNRLYRDITLDEDGDPYDLLYYLKWNETAKASEYTQVIQMANARKFGLVKLYDARTDANKNSLEGAPAMKLFTESIDNIDLVIEGSASDETFKLKKPW